MYSRTVTNRIQARSLFWVLVFMFGWCVASSSPVLAESGKQSLAEEFFAKGLGYYWAQDIPQHYEEAFVWLSKASEYGHPRAQSMVADMYANGLGVTIDHPKAFGLAKVANERGDVFGSFLLGKYFYWGTGTPKNVNEAKKIFSRTLGDLEHQAESDDLLAQHGLGWVYHHFSDTTHDYKKAHHWYERAAVQGYAVAQNNLGVMFGRGDGVRKNSKAEIVWYRRAAEQNYPVAQYNLALSLGNEGDLDGKYNLLVLSANQNYAPAQAKAGWMKEKGKGGAVDIEHAIFWYQKAANQGHRWAQNHLGSLYEEGHGVSRDYQEAMKWYLVAAANEYASGVANVGHLFEKGLGVERNYVEALAWYERGAKQGNTYSQARLGYLYMNGFGVERDLEKATDWLKKAARGGNEWARYGIGLIHEEQRQYSQAIRWYLWAAINGYDFGFKRAVYLMVLYPVISLRT